MRIEVFEFSNQVRLYGSADGSSASLARIDSNTWTRTAGTVREAGGRLISLWGAEQAAGMFVISAAYALEAEYPDLSTVFPCATRMQRAVYDLLGLRAIGAEDSRPWLNHGNWPADY